MASARLMPPLCHLVTRIFYTPYCESKDTQMQ